MKKFSFSTYFRRLFGFNHEKATKEPVVPLAFSPGYIQVISFSQEEAVRLGDTRADVHHLILGMLRRGEGGAINLLKSLGVSLEALRDFLAEHFPEKGTTVVKVDPRKSKFLTKEVEKILKITYLEAKNQKSPVIHSEYILLAMFREEGLAVVKLLYDSFHITYEKLRDSLSKIPS